MEPACKQPCSKELGKAVIRRSASTDSPPAVRLKQPGDQGWMMLWRSWRWGFRRKSPETAAVRARAGQYERASVLGEPFARKRCCQQCSEPMTTRHFFECWNGVAQAKTKVTKVYPPRMKAGFVLVPGNIASRLHSKSRNAILLLARASRKPPTLFSASSSSAASGVTEVTWRCFSLFCVFFIFAVFNPSTRVS